MQLVFLGYRDFQALITWVLDFSLSSMPVLYFEVSINSIGLVYRKFVKSSNFAITLEKSINSTSIEKLTQALLM